MKNIDQYRGCLVGGGAGDALGYIVEFENEEDIFSYYGDKGITHYELKNGKALISDDTQMTLFTANGLLLAITDSVLRGIEEDYPYYVNLCYKDWYKTQMKSYPLKKKSYHSWLANVPGLFSRRAPGNTCLFAIEDERYGTMEEPINQSKGCGGVMRVAPIGLYFEEYSMEEIDKIGAECAALTHGHPLGYIPAAALVHMIHLIVHKNKTIIEAVEDMKKSMGEMFKDNAYIDYFIDLINDAIDFSKKDINDLEAIHMLGEGWVAEETLAIAIYCSLKYSDDFDKALITSVNHKGDSDSTGAVTGNIVGAFLGYEGIPQKYKEHLEFEDILLDIADDLYNDCQITEVSDLQDDIWEQKYLLKNYCPLNESM